MRWVWHGAVVLFLTLLTQLGGLAWLIAVMSRRRLVVFALAYGVLWAVANAFAPVVGRVPLSCTGEPLRMQSPVYCVLMRNFVSPELADVADRAAAQVAAVYPGTITLALDGGFPFLDGFPLLPHLSHDDGDKLDFAFFYADVDGAYLRGKTRSPIGYWAFETLGADSCPRAWPSLRWDLRPLQSLWPDRPLEPARTRALIVALARDDRVGRVFVEPPLARTLGVSAARIGFQGCRAARHDDHIQVQL